MEKVDIYNQMAQYNFSTPINVTMIFEEDCDEGSSNVNILKEQIQNNNNKPAEDTLNSQRIISDLDVMSKTIATNEIITVDITEDNNECEQYNNASASAIEASSVYNQKAKENASGLCKIYQTNARKSKNEHFTITSYFNKSLDTISEHIILIMRRQYHCHYNNNKEMDASLRKELNKLKAHLFDLSYSTVVSLILPQENNEIFMNKLIDKTVFNANKIFKGKCERKHIQPFYNEMITWAKNKKEQIKSLGVSHFSDPNLLKQRLIEPSLHINGSINSSKNTVAIHNKDVIGNLENNVCIFSTGEPGKEISINVTPSLLINHFTQQQTNSKKVMLTRKGNGYKNTKASNDQHTTPLLMSNEERMNHLQHNIYPQNSTIHYKPLPSRLPPPYSNLNISNNNNYSYSVNRIHQNQTMQNYQTAQKFPYTRSEQQYSSQIQGHNLSPIINNVTARNPSTFPPIGRCSMCGKATISKCLKCNNYSYCSTLCQELDAESHQATCENF